MDVYSKSIPIPFYFQLARSSVLWPIGPFWRFMAFGDISPLTGHILQPLALSANSPPHQTPGQYLCFGPGGPPTASTDRGLSSMGPLDPFWPKSNEAKGCSPPATRPGGPPEPNFAPNLNNCKNGQKGPRTQAGHHLRFSRASPQFRGRSLLLQRIQAWCIYGIIYHYAPFSLINPMVMFLGHNYVFPIQVSKSITHFEGRLFSNSLLQSLAPTRGALEDPNHLVLRGFGFMFLSGLSQG
ncbi:hypothetical protein O181_015655 [Austropuccinia psidii MF-1]|uniref:Uncharacterized protein n=1 Tax=Austropuccinia psidii MF-1 TaxID=1389203 RepID=A0A9Q3C3C6_9BASI|nr:hypothetical protein [Austropuccinia psidii MF-1]